MPTATLDKTITLSFAVKDRIATAAWYKKHFGFEQAYDAPEIGWCELTSNADGVTIGLSDSMDKAAGNCVPVFGTPDIAVARKALEDDKVRFDGDTIVIDGMVKLATFYDPDDNALMLAQDLGG